MAFVELIEKRDVPLLLKFSYLIFTDFTNFFLWEENSYFCSASVWFLCEIYQIYHIAGLLYWMVK